MALPPDYGPESSGRMKGVTVVKPIVYGNVARYFGKEREEDGHTHQWTVYVKPYLNEDVARYVRKVHYKLHDSYATPNRILQKPPYEVTETGWGEFEIVIKIYFHDPNERPVTLYHLLKLYQGEPDVLLGQKTVVSEFYEEIVFQDPTNYMNNCLNSASVHPMVPGPWNHETNFEEKKEKTLKDITAARNKMRQEIDVYKERLKLAKETIAQFKSEMIRQQVKSPASINNTT